MSSKLVNILTLTILIISHIKFLSTFLLLSVHRICKLGSNYFLYPTKVANDSKE